jgi:hypothetical protein
MKFIIKSNKQNHVILMRSLGYHLVKRGESFAKRLASGEFPRLHVYLKDVADGLQLSIHLDQKAACYTGSTAHSGDYDGDILEQEKQRILDFINKQ